PEARGKRRQESDSIERGGRIRGHGNVVPLLLLIVRIQSAHHPIDRAALRLQTHFTAVRIAVVLVVARQDVEVADAVVVEQTLLLRVDDARDRFQREALRQVLREIHDADGGPELVVLAEIMTELVLILRPEARARIECRARLEAERVHGVEIEIARGDILIRTLILIVIDEREAEPRAVAHAPSPA